MLSKIWKNIWKMSIIEIIDNILTGTFVDDFK